jgi:hypothetical protein
MVKSVKNRDKFSEESDFRHFIIGPVLVNIKQQLTLFFGQKNFEVHVENGPKEGMKPMLYLIYTMEGFGKVLKMNMGILSSLKNVPIHISV